MGYFSNGTEAMMYWETYCSKCIHNPTDPDEEGCAVWFAHEMRNYEECNDDESILHILIPRNGIWNEQCKMLVEK